MDAREKFFREHLGLWTADLLKAIRAGIEGGKVKPIPFYEHLIELFQLFLDDRKESLS
jgi:TorA maturation chaperone TorD